MLSGEGMECPWHVAVFGQFGGDLFVFHTVCCDEKIKRSLGIRAGFGLCKMSCRWPLALTWIDLGIAFSTLPVLWNLQRCSLVAP